MVASPIPASLFALARGGARLLVASASPDGAPHLDAADFLRESGPGHLELRAWFCLRTVANLGSNPRLSLLVLAPDGTGYQVAGEVRSIDEAAILDGWDPSLEEREPGSQVERVLRIAVAEVLVFADRAHSDTPLQAEERCRRPGRRKPRC